MKRALLALIVVALIAPFATKAYHTDTPLFLWSADALRKEPWAPYHLSANWFGVTQPILKSMWNPPAMPYAIALMHACGLASELWLHVALLVPAVGFALAVYGWAARRERCSPMFAALFAIASPAFLVAATNALPDVWMAACVIGAMSLWVRGIDREERSPLLCAAALCALGTASKYFAVSLIPYLAVYALLQRRRIALWLPPLVLAALPIVAYETWIWIQTGTPPSMTGFDALGGHRRVTGENGFERATLAIAFLGAACLPMCGNVVASAMRNARAALASCAAVSIAAWLATRSMTSSARSGAVVIAELVVFASIGTCVVLFLVHRWRSTTRPLERWLIAWIAWECAYAAFLNWSVTERGFLTSVAIIGVFAAMNESSSEALSRATSDAFPRAQSTSGASSSVHRATLIAMPIVASLAIGLAASLGDWQIASSAQRAANDLVLPHLRAGETVWFQGHWGFQYYAQALGAKPMEIGSTDPKPGELVAIPMINTNVLGVAPHDYEVVDHRAYPVTSPLTTLGPLSSAGYYASILGVLPFGANLGDSAEYWVFRRR
jgi:hypothetical protein